MLPVLNREVLAFSLRMALATGWFITPRIPTEQLTHNFLEKLIVLEIEKSPGNAVLYYDLANVYLNQEKFAKAITAYRHAIWLNPKFPPALNNLANMYYDLREWERAEEMYRRSIEVDDSASGLDVGDGKGDVMHALAPAFEEPANR